MCQLEIYRLKNVPLPRQKCTSQLKNILVPEWSATLVTTDYLYIEMRKRNPVVFLRHYFWVQTQENICAAVNNPLKKGGGYRGWMSASCLLCTVHTIYINSKQSAEVKYLWYLWLYWCTVGEREKYSSKCGLTLLRDLLDFYQKHLKGMCHDIFDLRDF